MDNSTNYSDATDAKSLPSRLLTVAVIGLAMCVAIILNFVATFTYLRQGRRKSPPVLSTCLAVTDFLNSVSLVLLLVRLLDVSPGFEHAACTAQPYLTYCGNCVSGGLVVAVAFERCRKVSRPHRGMTRSRHWITVLIISLISVSISFTIVAYRILGYRTACSAYDRTVEQREFSFLRALRNQETAIIVLFPTTVTVLFLVGFVIIIAKYVTIAKFVCSQKHQGNRYLSKSVLSLIKYSKTRVSEEKTSKQSPGPVDIIESDASSSLSMSSEKNSIGNSQSNKTRDVFTLYPESFFDDLSRIIQRPSGSVLPRNVPAECQDTHPRRRASSASMMTRPGSRSPRKTVVMLALAVMSYLLYFPYLCLHIADAIWPGHRISFGHTLVYDLVQYSYICVYICNPVLYTFCNRGFMADFARACGCRRSLGPMGSGLGLASGRSLTPSCGSNRNSYNLPTANGEHLKREYLGPGKYRLHPYLRELNERLHVAHEDISPRDGVE